MKNSTLFNLSLLFFFIPYSLWAQTSSSASLQHKISLRLSSVSLPDALDEIQRLSGVDITYNIQQINAAHKVTITAANEPIVNVLNTVLTNTDLTYKQVGSNIVITKAPAPKKAAYGSVEGVVRDHETGERLPGCTITLQGTTKGTASNTEGSFRLEGIAEGVYTIAFSYIGFKPVVVPGVQVKANAVTRVNQELVADNVLGEVEIKATIQLENSTELSVINEIRGSNNIVTGISNEQISRSLDRDAAEVVRRATGVTILQDRFVIIRGLEPRYTLTLLNDIPTPSAESDRRSFSFDMLNSSIIDRVMVYKTPAPELPADFAGGVVKVYTKNSANSRVLQVQLSSQYRQGSSFTNYNTYKGGKTDWLGYDDGTRSLPDKVPAIPTNFPVPGPGAGNELNNALNARLARSFPNNWNLMNARSDVDKRAVVNYYTSLPLGKGYLNSLSSLTYTSTTDINRIQRRFQLGSPAYDSLGVPTTRVADKPVEVWTNSATEVASTESARITAMQNLRWVITDQHAIEFKNFFNQLGRDRVTIRDFRNGNDDPGIYVRDINRRIIYNFRSRSLYAGALSGEHNLNKPWLTSVNWRFGYGYTNDQQPDLRNISFIRQEPLPGFGEERDPAGAYRYFLTSFSYNDFNRRIYNTLKEDAYTGAIDLEKKFPSEVAIKLGAFYDYRSRSFTNRIFMYSTGQDSEVGQDSLLTKLIPGLPFEANQLFDRTYFRNDGKGIVLRDGSGFAQADQGLGNYRYDANNRQQAAYGALNLPLLDKKLNIYTGARVEWNRYQFPGDFRIYQTNPARIDTVKVRQTKLYVLPSINITYHLSPKMQIRAAYGMSLNRPEFREVAPVLSADVDRNIDFQGNYQLTNAEVQNIDFRWEYYPQEDEMLSVGVYYKSFRNAIELFSIAAAGSGGDFFNLVNTPRAIGYGLELEARKRLEFIPVPFFRHLAINANVTLLKTEIDISDQITQTGAYVDLRRPKRPLQGSSPYTINVSLYYDNQESGTQVTALYNVIGQRLTAVGNYFSAELYERPRQVVDFTVTQRLSRHVRIRGGVQDILNQPFQIYRDVDRSRTYNPKTLSLYEPEGRVFTKDYLEESYRAGSYYSLGILLAF